MVFLICPTQPNSYLLVNIFKQNFFSRVALASCIITQMKLIIIFIILINQVLQICGQYVTGVIGPISQKGSNRFRKVTQQFHYVRCC